MSFADDLRIAFPPPHPAGRPFILRLRWSYGDRLFHRSLAVARWAWCIGLFCLFFFRDPARVPPDRAGAILAPADGRVVSVAPGVPPAELGLGPAIRWRISIFLSVLNVHVNRVPAPGTVTRIAYRHGAFLNASLDKASDANERNAIALRLPDGRELAVVQIAGLIARRILCSLARRRCCPRRRSIGHHTIWQPDRFVFAGRRATTCLRRSNHDRRRDRDRGIQPMSEPVRRFPLRRSRRLRPRVRPRYRGPSFNRIVPNLMTMVGLCAGLTAMRFAVEGRFESAAVAITVAGVIDGLDGRLARLLKGTSLFGAEFDSLSDFACFGVAPGLTLYEWSLQRVGGFGFAVCVLFAVCMALRLARFNAMADDRPRPAYAYNFFTGVPAPAGAGLALFPIFLGLEAKTQGLEITGRGDPSSVVLRSDPGRDRRSAGLFLAGLELQEFQGSRRIRSSASAWHRAVRRTLVRGSLGCAGGRGADLPGDVAVQRAKLPPLATRSRGPQSGRGNPGKGLLRRLCPRSSGEIVGGLLPRRVHHRSLPGPLTVPEV